MKRLIPLVLTAFLLLASSFPRDVYIDERTNTGIFLNVQEKIFPKHWYYKQINAETEPLTYTERNRMIHILNEAFSKYPDGIIRENLSGVYLFRKMRFYGVPYGGTNYRNNIYLVDDESNPNFSDDFIEGVFHHEFSSILLRNYADDFDRSEWQALNPPGFLYGNGGIAAIINGEASLDFDPDLNEQGFLTRYSQSGIEEDINMFAQHLFDNQWEFWSIVEVNDRIRNKTDFLIRFYHSLDPVFTEDYFRNIYRSTAAR